MDERSQPIKVTIFGTEYPIKGDADPIYVNKLAKYVDEKMLELTSGRSSPVSVRLAVMAAFNIADELFQLKDEIKKLEAKRPELENVNHKVTNLVQMLDELLATDTEK